MRVRAGRADPGFLGGSGGPRELCACLRLQIEVCVRRCDDGLDWTENLRTIVCTGERRVAAVWPIGRQ